MYINVLDVVGHIAEYASHNTRTAMKLCCSTWNNIINSTHTTESQSLNIVNFIPKQIHHIYTYCNSTDISQFGLITDRIADADAAAKYNIIINYNNLTDLLSTSCKWPTKPLICKLTHLRGLHLENKLLPTGVDLSKFIYLTHLTICIEMKYLVLPRCYNLIYLKMTLVGFTDYKYKLDFTNYNKLSTLIIYGNIDIIDAYKCIWQSIVHNQSIKYIKFVFRNASYVRVYTTEHLQAARLKYKR